MLKFLLAYLLFINFITFVLYGYDKRRAKKQRWRVPESTLLTFSFVGGSVGALLGMSFFRHKTKKLKFNILVPFSLVLQDSLCVVVKDCFVA